MWIPMDRQMFFLIREKFPNLGEWEYRYDEVQEGAESTHDEVRSLILACQKVQLDADKNRISAQASIKAMLYRRMLEDLALTENVPLPMTPGQKFYKRHSAEVTYLYRRTLLVPSREMGFKVHAGVLLSSDGWVNYTFFSPDLIDKETLLVNLEKLPARPTLFKTPDNPSTPEEKHFYRLDLCEKMARTRYAPRVSGDVLKVWAVMRGITAPIRNSYSETEDGDLIDTEIAQTLDTVFQHFDRLLKESAVDYTLHEAMTGCLVDLPLLWEE